jgi:hypothetical protein
MISFVHAAKYVPGAYALVVNDDPPDNLRVRVARELL